MVLFQKVDFCMGVNIRIFLIVTIVNWTIQLIFLLHEVDFQGCFS